MQLLPAFRLRSVSASDSSFGSACSFLGIPMVVQAPPRFARVSNRNPRSKQNGFSLIELLIVIAIILTIAAIAIPSLMASIDQAHIARAVGDIHAIQSDVTLYWTVNGNYPDMLAQVGDDALTDPWGNPYQYLNHATMKGNGQARKDKFLVPLNDDYDLYSMGKDGKSAGPLTAKSSQDDVVRASNGGYIGLASQF